MKKTEKKLIRPVGAKWPVIKILIFVIFDCRLNGPSNTYANRPLRKIQLINLSR
jgi:hypothetical protein